MTAAHALRCNPLSETSEAMRAYEYRFTLPPTDTQWRRNKVALILAKTANMAHNEFLQRWPDAELIGVQLRSADMDVIVVGD